MRYINIENIELPKDWEERARKICFFDDFDTLSQEERKERIKTIKGLIEKNSNLWSELKPILAKLSYQKCWYCEMTNLGSNNDVDHFRPKKRIIELKEGHDGYWWLAFEWRNYRFSCEHCNRRRNVETEDGSISSGGKWDNFPILDEDNRAFLPSDSLEKEHPLLLDPINPLDVELLWFDDEGKAVPRISVPDQSSIEYRRACVSIELYHLNHPLRIPERKKIYNRIKRLVLRGNRHYKNLVLNWANSDAQENLKDTVIDLKDLIADDAELSATAKAYIFGFRGKDSVD
ncbi:MAG: 5-methylcytosine-specific restriction endonuclease McrA [Chloroflexi bacterium AL-W]|nr:5-methylcytosine-specific restriction endonuclease McrA [Chloroflexi bacterium AL-N1]NOK67954.1 5-methylcytosine-specific restriction endonuclease McrA [Chloroflexi bacterium AL-N10]NOK73294.1 5-methylcytosine-specific restriction endonuclease McrA [Chloroflexi bacterium AL-N5]NOK83208.1 5-methylcytosine-specific restriction endonuclease McrA [Chloroflexi bacterium AL-W]NOK87625.1 5-methylcytosine-specific restriction endonuclease McrA [Chloroflexi bacterium AL-N15]